LPLADSLFGILLLTITPPPVAIWRWCSAFALATQVPSMMLIGSAMRKIPAGDLHGITKVIYYPIALLGLSAMALQLINIAVWNSLWPFFYCIFVLLMAAVLQFLRLVLLPPHERSQG
jgi:hypothetical protein